MRSRAIHTSKLFATATALLLASAFVVLPTPGAAVAHDQLIDSSPKPDEVFEEAPSEVTLQYSAEVIEIGAEIVLNDAEAGEPVEFADEAEINYDTITQPLPELSDGEYELAWRVVSQDGHPISGVIPFTVAGGAEAGDSAGSTEVLETEGTEDSVPEANAPAAEVETGAADESGTAEEVQSDEGNGFSNWTLPIVGIVGILVLGGAMVLLIKKLGRPGNDDQLENDSSER